MVQAATKTAQIQSITKISYACTQVVAHVHFNRRPDRMKRSTLLLFVLLSMQRIRYAKRVQFWRLLATLAYSAVSHVRLTVNLPRMEIYSETLYKTYNSCLCNLHCYQGKSKGHYCAFKCYNNYRCAVRPSFLTGSSQWRHLLPDCQQLLAVMWQETRWLIIN